jgi:hypothetical protein
LPHPSVTMHSATIFNCDTFMGWYSIIEVNGNRLRSGASRD